MKATLRLLRLEKGLSLKDVGFRVSVSDNTVLRWERGAHQPSLAQAVAYADALGITLDELISLSQEAMSRYVTSHPDETAAV